MPFCRLDPAEDPLADGRPGHRVRAFMRDPSLSDPEWQKKIRDRLTETVRAYRAHRPLFYNLGDVIYFNGQSEYYRSQFYEPYQYYQPHIFAIPGNHDGDIHTRKNDPPVTEPSLAGFMTNFCD